MSCSMLLEDDFDFQAPNDIRIKGHRIGIETILEEYVHESQTPEQIAARYPTLILEQVYATILYCSLAAPGKNGAASVRVAVDR